MLLFDTHRIRHFGIDLKRSLIPLKQSIQHLTQLRICYSKIQCQRLTFRTCNNRRLHLNVHRSAQNGCMQPLPNNMVAVFRFFIVLNINNCNKSRVHLYINLSVNGVCR